MVGHGWATAACAASCPAVSQKSDSSNISLPQTMSSVTHPRRGSQGHDSSGERAAGVLQCIPFAQLCPTGFVAIWAQQGQIAHVVSHMCDDCGFTYVENLTWVLTHANRSLAALPGDVCSCSHLTLLIFRQPGALLRLPRQFTKTTALPSRDCRRSVARRSKSSRHSCLSTSCRFDCAQASL